MSDEGKKTKTTPVVDGTDAVGKAAAAIDVTLIDEMLRLSPLERLRQNDRIAALAARLREAFEGRKP
ncbi:MAG TPA: hypothetical protein VGL59_09465 [Polyangia bacterium]|jgi:hypothetical protein